MATNFADLGVHRKLIKGLKELGIHNPTEIQEKAIPHLLQKGGDIIGQAQTGTGKTAAFGLPLLSRIKPRKGVVQAVVLCPTRELGKQIAKHLFRYTKYTDKIFTEAVYGGEKIDIQLEKLKRPTHIIVATPGRLIDLIERKAVNLKEVHTVVLDEADEMVSMGFKDQLRTILEQVEERDTWLFSATMPDDVQDLIKKYMSHNALRIRVDEEHIVNRHIDHRYILTDEKEKFNALTQFLRDQGDERGVIFTKTKAGAQTLAKQLTSKNYTTDSIHGDLLQKERDKVMRAFKNEAIQMLIATDVAARGIDVEGLKYVVHYNLPEQLDYYTHRSGRTARAGRKGISVCIVTDRDLKRMKHIENALGLSIKGYTF